MKRQHIQVYIAAYPFNNLYAIGKSYQEAFEKLESTCLNTDMLDVDIDDCEFFVANLVNVRRTVTFEVIPNDD